MRPSRWLVGLLLARPCRRTTGTEEPTTVVECLETPAWLERPMQRSYPYRTKKRRWIWKSRALYRPVCCMLYAACRMS
ncbi:hypothetical protein QBC44DRAFT_328361 [Cladorrhinum sp. PSN332]|nr:hypothetical protein QBC44DRAFT_328361 [Cladorrhinum sp. PSN332]